MARTLLDQNQVCEILKPYEADLAETVLSSWDGWMEHGRLRPDAHVEKTPRTRATYVHDEFVWLARRKFDEHGISSFMEEGVFFLDFGNGLLVCHHKLDESGRPYRGETDHARGLCNQFWLIPDVKPVVENTVVVVGYEPDESKTEISRIKIICMDGNTISWVYRIYNSDEVSKRFGVEPIREVSVAKEARRVRVKRAELKKTSAS